MNGPTLSALLLATLTLGASAARPAAEVAPLADDEARTQAELEAVTAEIQAEVAELRGQEFLRPVAVQVTDGEGFVKYALERLESMGGKEQLQAEEELAKMLGLVPPSMDYLQVTLDMLEGQVGGFYDPASEAFYLMEAFTGPIARIILAHELTHALDDQLYDLDGTFEARLDDRDGSAAFSAVVEGSGTAVMNLWTMQNIGELDPEDLKKISDLTAESMAGVPAALWKPMIGSYTQGQAFLNKGYRLLKREGKSMTDVTRMAFEDPPHTTEQILHPEKYWDAERRDEPLRFELGAPDLPEGWGLLDQSTLGEMALAMLAEEEPEVDLADPMSMLSVSYTNDAARGWGGDRTALYGRGADRFLFVVTYWDSEEDASEFAAALGPRLGPWRAALGELDAEGRGSGVELSSEPDARRVTIRASFGVSDDEAERLAAAQRYGIPAMADDSSAGAPIEEN